MKSLNVYTYMVDLFKEPLYVAIGEAPSFVNWAYRKFGVSLIPSDRTTGMHWCLDGGKEGGYVNIIWMPEWDNSIESNGTLLHEVVHYIAETLTTHAVPMITVQDKQVQSEFLAYFVRQVYTELLARVVEGETKDDREQGRPSSNRVNKRHGKADKSGIKRKRGPRHVANCNIQDSQPAGETAGEQRQRSGLREYSGRSTGALSERVEGERDDASDISSDSDGRDSVATGHATADAGGSIGLDNAEEISGDSTWSGRERRKSHGQFTGWK